MISTLFNFSTNDEENWLAVNAWLKKLRSKGLCIIFLHHAGKTGLQRGSSKAEDLLDISIKLENPDDYRVEEGLRANLTFDKTRGVAMIDGEFQVSMEVKDGVAEFLSSPIGKGETRKRSTTTKEPRNCFSNILNCPLENLRRSQESQVLRYSGTSRTG